MRKKIKRIHSHVMFLYTLEILNLGKKTTKIKYKQCNPQFKKMSFIF
jgi:hypothetical protein